MNTEKYIEGSIRGNASDQRRIFDVYSGRMLCLCKRYLKNPPDAEDAFIKAFQKVFQNLHKFEYRGEDSLGKWISTIMVNECLMLIRSSKSLEKIDDIPEYHTAFADVKNSETDYIYDLIRCLPMGYRTVFNLFVVEGYTHREIAQLLGISEGTSKSQLNKARNLLQIELSKKKISYGT